MSLLAEEIVEEWLNRFGWFTIRGVKVGAHEMDLLAIKPQGEKLSCRHIEVQASPRPIGYHCLQGARKRSEHDLRQGVKNWIEKKFDLQAKMELKNRLCEGPWSRELVIINTRHPEELEILREAGVKVYRLRDMINELVEKKTPIVRSAGGDLLELVMWHVHFDLE